MVGCEGILERELPPQICMMHVNEKPEWMGV